MDVRVLARLRERTQFRDFCTLGIAVVINDAGLVLSFGSIRYSSMLLIGQEGKRFLAYLPASLAGRLVMWRCWPMISISLLAYC